MLRSTLTPFPPPHASFTIPPETAVSKQTESMGEMGGEYRIQSEVKREQHASERAAEWICGKTETFYKVLD